ncbi:MAG: hypothetical protein AAGF93_15475 [Cyanobacteria bacterium P01_H01_bin.105]
MMLADSPSPDSLTLINRAIISTPLTVTADALLEDEIAQMHQTKSSYILSIDQQRPARLTAG